MRFEVELGDLRNAVGLVARAVSTRSTLPILGNLKVTAADGALVLEGTDLELSLRATVPAKVAEPGQTTIDSRLLGQVLSAMPAGSVRVSVDDQDRMELLSGTAKMSLNGLPADEYPALPEVDGQWLEFDKATLDASVARVMPAVSDDDTRARLTAICWINDPDGLRLVATDTHRLATDVVGEATGDPGQLALVPARALATLERIAGQSVLVCLTESQAAFEVGRTRLTTRLVEGEFPNWRRLKRDSSRWTAELDTAPLTAAVRRAVIVCRDENRKVKLSLEPGRELALEAVSTRTGRSNDTVPATVEGEGPLELALNVEYLLDALNVAGEQVQLGLEGGNQLIMVHDPARPDYHHFIMPMQL